MIKSWPFHFFSVRSHKQASVGAICKYLKLKYSAKQHSHWSFPPWYGCTIFFIFTCWIAITWSMIIVSQFISSKNIFLLLFCHCDVNWINEGTKVCAKRKLWKDSSCAVVYLAKIIIKSTLIVLGENKFPPYFFHYRNRIVLISSLFCVM